LILHVLRTHTQSSGAKEGRSGSVWGVDTSARGKDIKKGYRNIVEIYVFMYENTCTHYENGKMRPVEAIQGMGEGG
jgi:hypothetical protein